MLVEALGLMERRVGSEMILNICFPWDTLSVN